MVCCRSFRRWWRNQLSVVAAALVLLTPAVDARVPPEPRPTNAPGLTVIPTIGPDSDPVQEPASYTVHLMPLDGGDRELVVPCGEPVQMPEGRFALWVEGRGRISSLVMAHGPGSEEQQASPGRLFVQLGPAGRVGPAPEACSRFGGDFELRLLSVDAHRSGSVLGHEFARRVALSDAGDGGVRMPTGSVLATVSDRERGRYVALAEPVDVRSGAATTVDPREPADDSSVLIVRLERPAPIRTAAADDVTVVLERADGPSVAPDILVPAAGRVYAVWRNLEPGRATLSVESPTVWLRDVPLNLRRGKIADAAERLQRRASLEVVLALPSDLEVERAGLTVNSAETGETLAAREAPPELPSDVTVRGLPREKVGVVADVGPWRFTSEVDLGPGDGRVVIAPEVARVTGRLTVNDEPARGIVGFLTNRSGRGREVASEHETDEWGELEAILFPRQIQPVARVSVGRSAPIIWWLEMPIADGDVIDIDLEGEGGDVRVVDGTTDEGIPQATVVYSWEGEHGQGGRRERTDNEGRLSLPPSPGGKVQALAKADGYRQSRRRTLDFSTIEDEVVFRLEPEEGEVAVTVLLPNGSPAVGAVVAILPTPQSPPRWTGAAGPDGGLELPETGPGEIVAFRHEAGGLELVRAAALASDEPHRVQLPPPAGRTVFTVVGPGGDPVPSALLAVWIDGFRLTNPGLSWLLQAPPGTRPDGTWDASHLPAEPIEILAWERSGDAAAEAAVLRGAHDYRRRRLQPPWGPMVTIEAVLP